MNAAPSAEASTEPLALVAAAVRHDDVAAARALASCCGAPAARTIAALRIHASTTRHSLIRALAEAVPSLVARMPAASFDRLASDFAVECPPIRAALTDWGEGFTDFLQRRGLPDEYVALARLDQAWLAALFAPEALPMAATALTAVSPDTMPHLRFVAHPALRLVALNGPHADGWLRAGALPEIAAAIDDGADGRWIMLTRPESRVQARLLAASTAIFLDALLRGRTLSDACVTALAAAPGFDLQASFGALLVDGAFMDFATGENDEPCGDGADDPIASPAVGATSA